MVLRPMAPSLRKSPQVQKNNLLIAPDLLLLRHNALFHFLVSGFGNNLLLQQFIFPLVESSLDDLLGIGFADSWQGFQLPYFGRRIDIL